MQNTILFVNSFMSYLLCFIVFAAAVMAAVFIGITARKKKNAKEAAQSTETEQATAESHKEA